MTPLFAVLQLLKLKMPRRSKVDFKFFLVTSSPNSFEKDCHNLELTWMNSRPLWVAKKTKQRHRGLRDIFQAIANTLDDKSITQTLTFEEQLQCVRTSLAAQSTLLIVDNFETLNDKDDVLSFLSELPNITKAIITSREKTIIHVPLRLECLSETESLRLINQQIAEKHISLTQTQIQQIQQRFGGMPIAIIYVIGQIANLVNSDIPLPADICQFCFESAIALFRGQPAHLLLMALAMFASPPMPSALIAVAGLTDDHIVESGLEILRSLSLISQMPDGQRYGMLSLTREYTLSEIDKYADLEALMRDRWIQWHLKYAETYGGKDWDDWHIRYDHLEAEWSNLSSVLTWCAERDRYTEARDLVCSLSYYRYLYGHWDNGLVILAWQKHIIAAPLTLRNKSAGSDMLITLKTGWRISRSPKAISWKPKNCYTQEASPPNAIKTCNASLPITAPMPVLSKLAKTSTNPKNGH